MPGIAWDPPWRQFVFYNLVTDICEAVLCPGILSPGMRGYYQGLHLLFKVIGAANADVAGNIPHQRWFSGVIRYPFVACMQYYLIIDVRGRIHVTEDNQSDMTQGHLSIFPSCVWYLIATYISRDIVMDAERSHFATDVQGAILKPMILHWYREDICNTVHSKSWSQADEGTCP